MRSTDPLAPSTQPHMVQEWDRDSSLDDSLKDLEWLIGTWRMDTRDRDVTTTYEWDENKKFIRGKYTDMEMTFKHPDLRGLWVRSYAKTLRKAYFGVAPKRAAMVLGLFHETPATRLMGERLVSRLQEVGETIGVFSDSERWRELAGLRFCSLDRDGRPLDVEAIRRQGVEWHE